MKTINDSECMKDFGDFIRSRRVTLGISQYEMAEYLGANQATYSRIENGVFNVDFIKAIQICRILDLDIADFVKRYM